MRWRSRCRTTRSAWSWPRCGGGRVLKSSKGKLPECFGYTVARALVRAVLALMPTRSAGCRTRSHECERCTQECVRHGCIEPCDKCGLRRGDFNRQLAKILAAKQLQQRLRERLDPLDNVLARFQFACGQPATHFAQRIAIAVGIVKHDEAFHARAWLTSSDK